MSADLTGAVLERLRAVLPAGVTVYDLSVGASPPQRYVVVDGDVGRRGTQAIDGVPLDRSFTVQVMSVVVRPYVASDCRWLAGRVAAALAGWRPTADDLAAAGLFEHVVSRRPVDDESVPDRHVTFAVDQFSVDAVSL